MCYTSGTTGNPKGVVYSHRSTWLHSFAGMSANALGATERDRVLVIVPMFHANAWGMPYTAFMAGTDLILPERFLQAEPLARMFAELRPTLSLGVPTIWNDLLRYSQTHDVDLSSLRMITAGGSAVPRTLMEAYRDRFEVDMIQGWGMTETSPVCAMAFPPKGAGDAQEMDWRAKTGRVLAGVEIRVVADDGDRCCRPTGTRSASSRCGGRGSPAPTTAILAGPVPRRVAADRRRRLDGRPGFHADLGPDQGRHQVRRRVDLVGRARERGHGPSGVFEAAVIGVPDPRWDERPLVVVVAGRGDAPNRRPCSSSSPAGWPGGGCPSVGLRRRAAQDERGEVRQEGAADPGGRRHHRDPRGRPARRAATEKDDAVGVEDLAERLAQLSEEIGDLAFDRLREASSAAGRGEPNRTGGRGETPDPGPAGRRQSGGVLAGDGGSHRRVI